MVRSEFGRFSLIVSAHSRVWNYIKYLKNKPGDSLSKIAHDKESSQENKDSLFQNRDKIYQDIFGKILNKEKIHSCLEKVKLKYSSKIIILNDGKMKSGAHQRRRNLLCIKILMS